MRPAGILAVVLTVVASVIRFDASAAPGLTITGDRKAWDEIKPAFRKLAKLKSYRAKVMRSDRVTLIQAVNPDRIHIVNHVRGQTQESIQVGRERRFREALGRWMCHSSRRDSLPPVLPTRLAGEVTAARGPVVILDGERTQTYTYTWRVQGTLTSYQLFVVAASGLPRRILVQDKTGKVQATIDYFDFDAPFSITLPSCG